MKQIAVIYHYSSDAEALDRVRPAHREFLGELYVKQILRASGPATATVGEGPAARALLVIHAETAEAALQLLDADPFYTAGLIEKREAMEWNVIFGPWS